MLGLPQKVSDKFTATFKRGFNCITYPCPSPLDVVRNEVFFLTRPEVRDSLFEDAYFSIQQNCRGPLDSNEYVQNVAVILVKEEGYSVFSEFVHIRGSKFLDLWQSETFTNVADIKAVILEVRFPGSENEIGTGTAYEQTFLGEDNEVLKAEKRSLPFFYSPLVWNCVIVGVGLRSVATFQPGTAQFLIGYEHPSKNLRLNPVMREFADPSCVGGSIAFGPLTEETSNLLYRQNTGDNATSIRVEATS